MPPSSSQANRAAHLLAIILVGLALLLLMGKSRRGPDGSQTAQAHLKSSGGVSFGTEDEGGNHVGKRPRPEIDKYPVSLAISKCYENVEAKMKEDEETRSKLISKTETDDKYRYSFSIDRREDLDAYVDQLIDEEAQQTKIDSTLIHREVALKNELLRSYRITHGKARRVCIFVPKNSTDDSSIIVTEGKADIDLLRIQPGEKIWRYDHLLQLDGVEQK
jgi:hypothetical protein